MRMRIVLVGVLLFCITACGLIPTAPLAPIVADLDSEFTLVPGQSATINGTDLKITLLSVPGDQRCPLNIECAASGPVSVAISVQSNSGTPQEADFMTVTDNDGKVPEMEFEGMTTRIAHDGYEVLVKSILPFPQNRMGEIKTEDYRVGLVVIKSEN